MPAPDMSLTATTASLTAPVLYNYSGCYFKPTNVAAAGYNVSWPTLTPDYCAHACSKSEYFWLLSGMTRSMMDQVSNS